jgi:hypothetical protein
MAGQEYHRFGNNEELFQAQEMKYAPETAQRIVRALGPGPFDDARHLLAPVPMPPPFSPLPDGPLATTEFVIDLVGRFPLPASSFQRAFPPNERGGLGFAQFWIQKGRSGSPVGRWQRLDSLSGEERLFAVALTWELASLLSEGTDAIRELAGYLLQAGIRAEPLFLVAHSRETPEEAARRAGHLAAIKSRFARTVEMRLLPGSNGVGIGRSFPARAIWRAAYALGMHWGDLDLFHWHDPKTGVRLFSMNAVGYPGYFLPERAAEGEGTPGIALSFELPRCPSPVATYDRMSVALAYLRQHLGGRTLTPDGAELDGDRLYDDRDALAEAVQEMSQQGIAPGSPTAERFF